MSASQDDLPRGRFFEIILDIQRQVSDIAGAQKSLADQFQELQVEWETYKQRANWMMSALVIVVTVLGAVLLVGSLILIFLLMTGRI